MKLKYAMLLFVMIVLYVMTYPPANSSMLLPRTHVEALENELEIMREAYRSECARSRILGDQLIQCQETNNVSNRVTPTAPDVDEREGR